MLTAHPHPDSMPSVGIGRSLWQDAGDRVLQNPVAMASLISLILVGIFAVFGPIFSSWTSEEIDWNVLGQVDIAGQPSLQTGHYFGTDQLGRDLFGENSLWRTCLPDGRHCRRADCHRGSAPCMVPLPVIWEVTPTIS